MTTTYDSKALHEFVNNYFEPVSEKVRAFSSEEFDRAFQSDVAKSHKAIVYIWRAEKSIPRLKGESNILYIGQTEKTLSKRYANWGRDWLKTTANAHKFSHILERYGYIELLVCDHAKLGSSLLKAEGQLLWWYFLNHCEYPPINYTKTKVRNDRVVVG